MQNLTKEDLKLVNVLSSRKYSGNSILNNATHLEKDHLSKIKRKLKSISDFIKTKYDPDYGIFESSIVTGNDIAIGGTKLKRIWSGIFKGNTNKQYSAQISFVINSNKTCLDLGFFFGRAHSHNISKLDKLKFESDLKKLAVNVRDKIITDKLFRTKYFDLCDLGFLAFSNNTRINFEDWINSCVEATNTSQIVVEVYPNEIGEIELSQIDFYVSQIVFLMAAINGIANEQPIKPLTIDQRARQLQRLTEIGLKGEKYIFELEQNKLKKFDRIPVHKSLISDHYGYDIHSYDEKGNELLIEVKTTCRTKGEYNSKRFFLTRNEHSVFEKNKTNYRLYRVYDIEGNPSYEELDLNCVDMVADGYICDY